METEHYKNIDIDNSKEQSDKIEEESDGSGILSNDILIPSGRQDGKGTRITVRYLDNSRNPI